MFKPKAYSAASATSLLASTQINRRTPTDRDVQIEILHCGVCHSDLHFARNERGFTEYPAVNLLKRDGNLTLVGAPEKPLPVAPFPLILRRRSFSGSLIGGLPETQEMLDFCGQHNITCDIEMIRIDEINTAYERMLKSDVKYRFVIDMASLKAE